MRAGMMTQPDKLTGQINRLHFLWPVLNVPSRLRAERGEYWITIYVTASQSSRRQRFGRQTQRLKTIRADRTAQETQPMEAGRSRHGPAQNQAGILIQRATWIPE